MFNEEYEEKFLFCENYFGKAECLICQHELAHIKQDDMKSHYESCHWEYIEITGAERETLINKLKETFDKKIIAASDKSKSDETADNCANTSDAADDGELLKELTSDNSRCFGKKSIKNVFSKEYQQEFLFFENDFGKPQCLVCQREMLHIKKYSMQRHYQTCHKEYKDITGDDREALIAKLKKTLSEKLIANSKKLYSQEAAVADDDEEFSKDNCTDSPKTSSENMVSIRRYQHNFLFRENFFGKPECLVCKRELAYWKKYNMQRHYQAYHKEFEEITGEQRKAFIDKLKTNFKEKMNAYAKKYLDDRDAATDDGDKAVNNGAKCVDETSETNAFDEQYELNFLFCQNLVGKPECLVCQRELSQLKKYNMQRHYYTCHKQYEAITGDERENLVIQLKKTFKQKMIDTRKNLRLKNLAATCVREEQSAIADVNQDGECDESSKEIMFYGECQQKFLFCKNYFGNPECLVCQRQWLRLKKYDMEMHYKTCHKEYEKITGAEREALIIKLKKTFKGKMIIDSKKAADDCRTESPTVATSSVKYSRFEQDPNNDAPEWCSDMSEENMFYRECEQHFLFSENYFGKPECLVCQRQLSNVKKYNMQRHYQTFHKEYDEVTGDERETLIKNLKKAFNEKVAAYSKQYSEIKVAEDDEVDKDLSNQSASFSETSEANMFDEQYELKFLFCENYFGKPECLVCQRQWLRLNKYDMQMHYQTCHKEYEEITGEEREALISRLKKTFKGKMIADSKNSNVEKSGDICLEFPAVTAPVVKHSLSCDDEKFSEEFNNDESEWCDDASEEIPRVEKVVFDNRIKRKNVLALNEKVAAIREYEKRPVYKRIGRMFHCSPDQIKRIMQQKETILNAWEQRTRKSRDAKTLEMKVVKVSMLGKAVYEWIRRMMYYKDILITDGLIQKMALQFKSAMGLQNFFPHQEWCDKFRSTYKIQTCDSKMLSIGYTQGHSVQIKDVMKDVLSECSPDAEGDDDELEGIDDGEEEQENGNCENDCINLDSDEGEKRVKVKLKNKTSDRNFQGVMKTAGNSSNSMQIMSSAQLQGIRQLVALPIQTNGLPGMPQKVLVATPIVAPGQKQGSTPMTMTIIPLASLAPPSNTGNPLATQTATANLASSSLNNNNSAKEQHVTVPTPLLEIKKEIKTEPKDDEEVEINIKKEYITDDEDASSTGAKPSQTQVPTQQTSAPTHVVAIPLANKEMLEESTNDSLDDLSLSSLRKRIKIEGDALEQNISERNVSSPPPLTAITTATASASKSAEMPPLPPLTKAPTQRNSPPTNAALTSDAIPLLTPLPPSNRSSHKRLRSNDDEQLPPIRSYAEGRKYLKLLEDFALERENFRLIGLITRADEVLRELDRKENNEDDDDVEID